MGDWVGYWLVDASQHLWLTLIHGQQGSKLTPAKWQNASEKSVWLVEKINLLGTLTHYGVCVFGK